MTSSTEVNPATNGQVNCEYRWTEDGKLTEFYVKLFEGVNLGFKVSYDKHSGEISDIIIPNLSQQPAIKYDNLGTDKISRIEHPLNGDIFDLTYLRGELQKISSSSTDSGREELELVYSDLFGGLGEWRFRTNEYPIPGEFFQRVTRRGPGGAPLTIETDSLGNNNPSGNQVINITYDPEDGRLLSFQRNLNPTVNFTYDPEDKYKPISSSAAGLSYPLEYNSLRQTVTYQAPYEEMIRTELTPTGHQRKLSIAEATGITYLNIIPSVHDGNLPFGVVYEKFNLSDGEHSGSWQLNFGEFNYCGGLFRTISTVEHVQQGNVFHAFINHLKGYLYIPGLRVSGDSLGLYRGWIGMLEFDLDTHILAALSAHQNSSPPYYPAPVKSTIFPLYKDFVDKVNVISRDIDQAIPNDLIYPNPHDPDLSYKTASGRDMIQKNPAEMTIDQLYRVSEKALRVDNYIQELLPALNTKFVPGVEPGHLATGMIERFYEPRDVLSAINQINDESSSRVNSKLNTYDKFNYSSGKTAFTGESAIENYLEQYTKSGLPKGSDNNYILGILGYNHLKDLRWRTVNPYQSTRKELLE
jgi:hypothetical protein